MYGRGEIVPLSEAKKQANKRWNEANPYDHVPLFVPLGGKAQIKEHAAAEGESVNAYINKAITARMGEDWRKDN